jgi:hypothetical protein
VGGATFGGAGCIVGDMTSLTGVFVGVILLLFGRRLYWLFVAGIGFLTGLALAPDLLPGQPEWVILLAALVAAVVGAVIAFVAQKITIGLIGFVAGGGVGLQLLRRVGMVGEGTAWIAYLIAGVVGLVLMLVLFDWALILLSSLAGANLIVTGVSTSVHLTQNTWFLALIALALIGVVVQAGLSRRWGRATRGRSGGPRPGSTSG